MRAGSVKRVGVDGRVGKLEGGGRAGMRRVWLVGEEGMQSRPGTMGTKE